MSLRILTFLAMISISEFTYAESAENIVKTVIEVYKDYRSVTKEPEETDLQKAGRIATPSIHQNKIYRIKHKKLAECHKQNDTVFMGSTFKSPKCMELEY